MQGISALSNLEFLCNGVCLDIFLHLTLSFWYFQNHNKALFPPWNMCKYMVDVATQANNSELAFYALGFLNTHIARGDNARPPHILSVEETLLLTALETAGKTYNTKLLDGAWLILIRSLRSKKAPSPESYHAKINAYASMGNLEKAFGTLQEFERIYGNTSSEAEDLFSPFGALHPLVVACCKNGFATLDSVSSFFLVQCTVAVFTLTALINTI